MAGGMFSFTLWQLFLLQQFYLEYISLPYARFVVKIVIRRVYCLNRNDRRTPGWHNASEMTLMILQEWGLISAMFPLLLNHSFFSHIHWVKCKLFNSLCNLPLYLAKTNGDLTSGHDFKYLKNYKAVLKIKIIAVTRSAKCRCLVWHVCDSSVSYQLIIKH